ncbi:prolyl aminopeptidase, partial [Actinosynnema sp. NPDC059797]
SLLLGGPAVLCGGGGGGRPPHAPEGDDLAAAYLRLLLDPDPAVHQPAADEWCRWEDAVVPPPPGPGRFDPPEHRLAFARIVTHYWAHGSWLPDNHVIDGADRLAGIPGVIVQGELDLGNLVGTPWRLTHAWPDAELVMIRGADHGGNDAMTEARVAATDEYR